MLSRKVVLPDPGHGGPKTLVIFGPISFSVVFMLIASMPAFHAMNSCMLRLRHHFQVFWTVIPFVPVLVVNNLTGQQGTAKFLFGNDTVHVSATQLDVVVSLAAIPQCVFVPKRCTSGLLLWAEETTVVTIDEPKRLTLFLAATTTRARSNGCR
jgi:hypothetical protein